AAAGFLLGAAILHGGAQQATVALLAPFGGRLLAAVTELKGRLSIVSSLEELARSVLGAARRAADDPRCVPELYLIDPAFHARIDASGEVRIDPRPVPAVLLARISDRPGEILVRSDLEGRLVRRPELRPLIEWLVHEDVLCVVPVATE